MTTCSQEWAELSAYGTAPVARFWLAIEQPGPWGRDAFTQSRLDPALGAALSARCSAAGGKALLLRHPASHAAVDGPRRVFLAGGGDAPWLLSGTVDDPEVLLGLDLDQPGPPSVPWLTTQRDPVLLVCSNGRRDRCCATLGRGVAGALEARFPGQVYECSHLSGHRFAATAVVLPLGHVVARLDDALGGEILDAAADGRLAAGALGPRHDRGRAHLSPEDAAAESATRFAHGDTAVPPGPGARVAVRRRAAQGPLAESCGGDPLPVWVWEPAPQ